MYYNNQDVRLEEIKRPQIGDGEFLVKVMASGICGSDVLEWYRLPKAPLVLGHEITGEIVEVGAEVGRFKEGDRVFVNHHVPCNTCYYCLNGNHTVCETLHTTNFDPGGFSEYVRVPSINVDRGAFILPVELSYEDGVFIEPLGCVIRGQRKIGFKAGQTMLILGSGISGLLHLMYARATGAGRIITTDINKYRLNMAKEFGADEVLHAEEDVASCIKKANNGRGADHVIVCTDAPDAFKQALKSVDCGGTILFFAAPPPDVDIVFPINEFWRNSITLMSTYANDAYDASVAIEMIRSRRVEVNKMITHRLGLEEAGEGFRLMVEAGESMKIIVEPQR